MFRDISCGIGGLVGLDRMAPVGRYDSTGDSFNRVAGGRVAGLCRLIWNVVATVSAFGEALEMNDATLRFPPSDDPALNRMSVSMNRIIEQYNKTRLDLETRKLYYDRILRIMSHELRNAITPIVSVSSDMEIIPNAIAGIRSTTQWALSATKAKG